MNRFLFAAASAVVVLTAASSAIAQDAYCLQGVIWGYPGNCQFASYAQCMASASGTVAYCGINPRLAFAPPAMPPYRSRHAHTARRRHE
jgi:Protein of unknown function (DUF3551)